MNPTAGGTGGERRGASVNEGFGTEDSLNKEIELKVVTRELLRERKQWKKWKYSFTSYLQLKDLDEVLTTILEDTPENRKKEIKVKHLLWTCIHHSVVENTLDPSKSFLDNWKKLLSIYDVVPMMTLNEGIDALNTIQVKQGQSLHDFIQHFDAAVTRINRLKPDYFKSSYYALQFLKKLPSTGKLEVVKQKYMEMIDDGDIDLVSMYQDFQLKVGANHQPKDNRQPREQ